MVKLKKKKKKKWWFNTILFYLNDTKNLKKAVCEPRNNHKTIPFCLHRLYAVHANCTCLSLFNSRGSKIVFFNGIAIDFHFRLIQESTIGKFSIYLTDSLLRHIALFLWFPNIKRCINCWEWNLLIVNSYEISIHTYIHTYIHTCMHACMHAFLPICLPSLIFFFSNRPTFTCIFKLWNGTITNFQSMLSYPLVCNITPGISISLQ